MRASNIYIALILGWLTASAVESTSTIEGPDGIIIGLIIAGIIWGILRRVRSEKKQAKKEEDRN